MLKLFVYRSLLDPKTIAAGRRAAKTGVT